MFSSFRFDRKGKTVSSTEGHTASAKSNLIIKIIFETGLLHVRGTQASSWIDEEFQRISEIFLTGVEPGVEDEETAQCQTCRFYP